MNGRTAALTLAGLLLAASMIEPAAAGERKKKRLYLYESAPEYVLRRPLSFIFGGGYAMTRDEFAMIYGDEPEFDEEFYDPGKDLRQPPAKTKTVKTKKPVAKPPVPTAKSEPATAGAASKQDQEGGPAAAAPKTDAVKTAAAEPAAPVKAEPEWPKPAPGALSCGKASDIIVGYGFSAVKPAACSGKTYAFNATRDGKAFTIKLDAATGELTEVKKQ
jgi:hypothetical protein